MELLHKITIELDTLEKDLKNRINTFIKENGVVPEIDIRFEHLMEMGKSTPVHTQTIINAHIVIGSKDNSASLKIYDPEL